MNLCYAGLSEQSAVTEAILKLKMIKLKTNKPNKQNKLLCVKCVA